jgi:hypothetical protein
MHDGCVIRAPNATVTNGDQSPQEVSIALDEHFLIADSIETPTLLFRGGVE